MSQQARYQPYSRPSTQSQISIKGAAAQRRSLHERSAPAPKSKTPALPAQASKSKSKTPALPAQASKSKANLPALPAQASKSKAYLPALPTPKPKSTKSILPTRIDSSLPSSETELFRQDDLTLFNHSDHNFDEGNNGGGDSESEPGGQTAADLAIQAIRTHANEITAESQATHMNRAKVGTYNRVATRVGLDTEHRFIGRTLCNVGSTEEQFMTMMANVLSSPKFHLGLLVGKKAKSSK
ncbi:uncharacterized protein MELLADRAFT_114234 [Melampsora larici-populina 98AG31]|uniref:Uncharacterized protein n=1 Tax=Melampsora larici-populina (strain 98AG31 / pathotype 3-4-7) TaxID=747676 RepID=F4SCQ8_MELLP|nr:uncharacterized protein MELLADRAFT_114234 [Melampsora larici-populina 98AG31]EGF97569.1 hypothetical protein MELLADRAFT_114234 [Melampsora larici-populina 98AG31]